MIVKAPSWGPFKKPTCVLQVPASSACPQPICNPSQVCRSKPTQPTDCLTPNTAQIILPTQIPSLNKYGPKTLRPPGSRSPMTEYEYIARRVMYVNGMSGQLV